MRCAILLLLAVCAMGADRKILIHGHRGARAVLPENTLPAFEYAIRVGADVVELDLAVTKDNVLVVSHDPEINAAICTGPNAGRAIRTLTLAEVKQHDCGAKANPAYPKQKAVPGTPIPTLDEVLALASRGRVWFNIEMKSFPKRPELTPGPEEYARLVLVAIKKHKLESRVIVQSFDFRTIQATKRLAPNIVTAALFQAMDEPFEQIAKQANADIAAPHYSLVTKEKVDAAHRAGLKVVPWTPNTPEDWQRMIAAGVDAIITDDPEPLVALLKK